MADTPVWVIPAMTAASSLMGTVVGGLVGYWTSTRMHKRTSAAEESRSRNTLLREGAIAFITGIERLEMSAALERITQRWGPTASRVLSPGTDDEGVREAARGIYPGIDAGGGRMQILMKLAKETGVLDNELREVTLLLSEIRLVAPADVADSAQRVAYAALAVQLTELAAPELNRHATFKYKSAVNEFFNRVRHHMSVEDIEFDLINETLLMEVLELEPDSKS
ncbi:MAG: hypothetical protein WD228_06010 [Mycobacterium sp.]